MGRAGLCCEIAICGASACLLALMAPALATDLIPTSETRSTAFIGGRAWWRMERQRLALDNHTGSIRSALRWWGRISTSMRAESSAEVRRDLIIRLALIGVEGSVAGSDLDRTIRSPFFPTSDFYSADVDFLTTVTGRIASGWLMPKAAVLEPMSSSFCSTMGPPGTRQLERLRLAGRSAAAANTRSARTFRLASSMTIPISISTVGGSDVRPASQAWAAACPSLTATSRCNL